MIGKEKIALILTLILLGLLGTCNLSEEERAAVRANEKGQDLPKLSVPELERLAAKSDHGGVLRDIFAAPRDVSPLPPLAIDLPPTPKRAILAPPVRPWVRLSKWGEFYRVPSAAHPFEFAPETQGTPSQEKPPGAAAGTPETTASAGKQEAYKKLYDWLRPNPYALVFGRITNPNRFELGYPKLRDNEALLLQEIDPETGKLKGKQPISWAPERVQEYGFADTIANAIEIRKRRISYTAANLPELIAFGDWCVEHGGEEPRAFLEAERIYKKATELDPANPAGALGLGRLYEKSFQVEEAYQLYQSMSEGNFKHRSEPFLALGKLQSRLRLFDLAEASMRRSVEIESSSPQNRSSLSEFYLERGRPDDAAAVMRELRAEPSSPEERARVRTISAEALLASGSLEEAANMFRQALSVQPQWLRAQLGLAACQYAKSQFNEGLQTLDAAIAQGFISTDLYTARGLFALRMGDYAAAERDLKSALGLDPLRDAYPLSALAFLYEFTGHAEEAVQAIAAAYTLDPTDTYVRYERARLSMSRESFDEARQDLIAVLNAEFRLPDLLALRADLSALQGEADAAERYYASACEIDSKNPEFTATRGINLLRAGQLRRAAETFRQTLAINPDQPSALNGLAYCSYSEGRSDEAIRTFAELIDRYKHDDEHLAYAKKTFADIQDHLNKVLWLEDFERTELRRDWKEETRIGPSVRLDAGSVHLEGQTREAGRTRLFRELQARAFLSFEATLSVDEVNQSIAGLHLVSERKVGDSTRVEFEVDIARLRNGKLATRLQSGQVAPEWVVHDEFNWPVGQPVKIAMERIGSAEDPKIRFWFNDVPVGSPEKFQRLKSASGDVRIGVFAESDPGRMVSLAMDSVRLVYRDK